MNKVLLAFFAILIVGASPAFAHPFTDQTIPAQFSSASVGTSEVVVIYSEAVEIDFSTLKVYDSNGDQVDSKDTRYFEGENSLAVTTPPLQEGVYTVTSKVLSKVDGHLVDYAFIFAVGNIQLDPEEFDDLDPVELIFFPEAGARFPGLVGQTVVLGAVIASILIWGTQRKDFVKEDLGKLQKLYHGKLMTITGFGLIIVFASNILMLTVQTLRLDASAFDALQTTFGMTWMSRMAITIALLGVWFAMERTKILSVKSQIPLLALSLVLIATTTMMGHGAASEQPAAIALDYVHNLVSSVWIGGIIFLAFVLLPSFASLKDDIKEKMSLVVIPKFSIMIVVSLGIVIISGPTLMWLLESNLGMITESTYGKLIILKILIAAIMIGVGAYHQFGIQKRAEGNIKSGKISVHKKFKRALKIEAGLGIALLAVVALLTNGTLPAGEIQTVDAQEAILGFSTTEFSEQAKFDVQIKPFSTGANRIIVDVTSSDGTPIPDMTDVKVKISNPQKAIAPIILEMEPLNGSDEMTATKYRGESTFGFSGIWQVELEAQRAQSANEGVTLSLKIKPHLENLKPEIIEYNFTEPSSPLYPAYDGDDTIWISDSSAPRVWEFSIADKEFTKHDVKGQSTIILDIDKDGKIWFTDIKDGQVGYFDPETKQSSILELPDMLPVIHKNIPLLIEVDSKDNIWIPIANKNTILRYDQTTQVFDQFILPTKDSGPTAVVEGPDGKIWFNQRAGQIGYIDPDTDNVREIKPQIPLKTPETMTFDSDGNIWIAEHDAGGSITKFNPLFETFERISTPNRDAFPNAVTFDRYENAWFAQHTVDSLGVFDPQSGQLMELPIPTSESWVQFTVSDNKNNIWFVEQKPYKLAMLKLTELPSSTTIPDEEPTPMSLRYTEVASPLIALGIVATSLFFVKGIKDKRRINDLIESD